MINGPTRFRTKIGEDNYILRDHVVHGVHVLPGVACLDLICRIAQAKKLVNRKVQLREVLFKSPIVASPGSRDCK